MRVTHHSNLKSCINSFVIDELIIESYFISKKFIFDWIILKVISVNDKNFDTIFRFIRTLVMHIKAWIFHLYPMILFVYVKLNRSFVTIICHPIITKSVIFMEKLGSVNNVFISVPQLILFPI